MLRSLILSSLVLFASNSFAHDHEHDHNHEHEHFAFSEDNMRVHIPVSCGDDSESLSDQCLKDIEAVKWINLLLGSFDESGIHDEETGMSIEMDANAYESMIAKIDMVRKQSDLQFLNFKNDQGQCEQAFNDFATSEELSAAVTKFCTKLSTHHSEGTESSWMPEFTATNVLGAVGVVAFTAILLNNRASGAALGLAVSMGLLTIADAVTCECSGKTEVGLCHKKLVTAGPALMFLGAVASNIKNRILNR